MSEIAVSPNFKIYNDRPNFVVDSRNKSEYPIHDIQTKILVYENCVTGWFLDYGEMLKKHHNAGFVVLQVALAQVEGIEQYRRGESSYKKSSEFFCSGLKEIFSLTDAEKQLLEKHFYPSVRCGLFHDGMTRPSVKIENRFPCPLKFDGENILISPNKFLDAVYKYFKKFITQLKEPANEELRKNFLKEFDRRGKQRFKKANKNDVTL